MTEDKDVQRIKQIAREVFWEILDSDLLPLLKDFAGIRADASKPKENQETKPTVPEDTFSVLSYQDEKGASLGDFQTAYLNMNIPNNFNHAFNVLKSNNAVIGSPFHMEGYSFRYWIFPDKYMDRIFRKKLEAEKVS